MTQIHGSQNLQSKEQSENQKLGDILHHLKLKNVNSLAVGHLNMNSLRNKFNTLKLLVKISLDIFMISEINETSSDETFPRGQFLMDGLNHHIGRIKMQMEVVKRFMFDKIYHPDKSR